MKTNFSKYAASPLSLPGVINHAFIDASDAPGQFEAEQANRQAVTALWLLEHPDVVGYTFSKDAADMGLDPWRDIGGVDRYTGGPNKGKLVLEYGRTGEKVVDPDFVVYASRKDVEREAVREHEERLDRNPRTKRALDIPMSGDFLSYRTRQVVALTETSLKLEEERAKLVEALRPFAVVLNDGRNNKAQALLREIGEAS